MVSVEKIEKAAAVLALCVALGMAYKTGRDSVLATVEADKAAAVEAQRKADVKEMDRRLTESQDNARLAQQSAVKTAFEQGQRESAHNQVTQAITNYVRTHPHLDDCSLDADGLRLWRAANAGTAP